MPIWNKWLLMPGFNLAESFVDNVIRDKVKEPELGSVVYCDLTFGYSEHSGIYVGNNEIVHLNKYGSIEIVSPREFIDGTTAMSIYVSCYDAFPVGCENAARRARDMAGSSRDYNVILDNCHQFTAGCLTGDFENPCNFLLLLKNEAEKQIMAKKWRVWDLKLFD